MAWKFDTGIFSVVGLAGEILPGSTLGFFVTSTSTPLATYSNQALSVANSNPIACGSDGRFGAIWMQERSYKVVLTLPDGTTKTYDPVLNPAGNGAFAAGTQTPVAGSVAQVLFKLENSNVTAESFGGYWADKVYFSHVINKEWTLANSAVTTPDSSPAVSFTSIAINNGSQADVVAEMAIVKATASNTASFGGNDIVTSSAALTGLKLIGREIDLIAPAGCTVTNGIGLALNFFNIHYPGAAILISNGGVPGGYTDTGILIQAGIGSSGTAMAISAFTLGFGLDFSQATFTTVAIQLGNDISHGIAFGPGGGGTAPITFGDNTGAWITQMGAANLFAVKDKTGANIALQVTSTGVLTLLAGGSLKIGTGTLLTGQQTGYGTPTGGATVSNFPGATATLAQTSAQLAQLIIDLKAGKMPTA